MTDHVSEQDQLHFYKWLNTTLVVFNHDGRLLVTVPSSFLIDEYEAKTGITLTVDQVRTIYKKFDVVGYNDKFIMNKVDYTKFKAPKKKESFDLLDGLLDTLDGPAEIPHRDTGKPKNGPLFPPPRRAKADPPEEGQPEAETKSQGARVAKARDLPPVLPPSNSAPRRFFRRNK